MNVEHVQFASDFNGSSPNISKMTADVLLGESRKINSVLPTQTVRMPNEKNNTKKKKN